LVSVFISDYLVRSLKLKRNRQSESGEVSEEREIHQYHYLLWKDFMAPEHPVGIIRFIKRFNEVYSLEKGPILVHCSAGVGRTGTLVALDSLLEQLKEEKCLNIFNTICDLRHQRNYLVQSLVRMLQI
jgi:protein-tyrosine phosphatase